MSSPLQPRKLSPRLSDSPRTAYSYVNVWRCVRCGSEDVSLAVEWMESVEPVDQGSDELAPLGSGPGDPSRLLMGICNGCDMDGLPDEVLQRRRVRLDD